MWRRVFCFWRQMDDAEGYKAMDDVESSETPDGARGSKAMDDAERSIASDDAEGSKIMDDVQTLDGVGGSKATDDADTARDNAERSTTMDNPEESKTMKNAECSERMEGTGPGGSKATNDDDITIDDAEKCKTMKEVEGSNKMNDAESDKMLDGAGESNATDDADTVRDNAEGSTTMDNHEESKTMEEAQGSDILDRAGQSKTTEDTERDIDLESDDAEGSKAMDDAEDKQERFQACMVLAGAGDTLGYYNGAWEFNPSGVTIHHEADRMGGVERIRLDGRKWMVSDDTVMHIATAEALLEGHENGHEMLLHKMAERYIQCMDDMHGRAPGLTCSSSVRMLAPYQPQGYQIPFNPRGGGCGAAMRAAPIGLYYWRPEQIDSLVEVAIESGRMTHNHPTGYLGSLATALFVSYAVQNKPLREWGTGLMKTLQLAKDYIISSGRDVEANLQNWSYFEKQWNNYLQRRKIEDGLSKPHADYNVSSVKARDAFYEELSFDGTGGASGHDAPMIAYEALLFTWKPTDPSNQEEKGRQWIELCKRSMLHGGDCDSTGIIAGACWGAMEGFAGVPRNHYEEMEYRTRLESLGQDLFKKANDRPKENKESPQTQLEQHANDHKEVVS